MLSVSFQESFKAYDVRGIVGETITAATVEATGAAFVDVLGLAGQTVLVGGDMRPSSPEFAEAFARGAAARGANPKMLGLISTDELYFACGTLSAAGVVFTASHNPAEYNGMKMALPGAVVACHEHGTVVARFWPVSWDHLFSQSWDRPARLAGGSCGALFDRRVSIVDAEVNRVGIQGGQCG